MIKKTKVISRAGLIDGLPNSYITSYVLQTNKSCEICRNNFNQEDIDENKILFVDFEFYHKQCLEDKKIKYKHQKENDKSSIVKLIT